MREVVSATRHLAAIVFTDLVGFTAMTQANEAEALRLVGEQKALLRRLLRTHHGRLVKSMGDGFLLEFPNALAAVELAVALQRRAHDRGAEPGGPRLEARVGIHLGDVEEQGADILGDAVNIASRIEPAADPGGICLSEPVFVQVRNKLPYQFEKLGERRLKGIEQPMVLYRAVLPWVAPRPTTEAGTPPRLAVLPLANMSPDPADEYFAEGLTEELITRLSGFPDLRVIARTSVLRYRGSTKGITDIGRELRVGRVLEGSVRKSGNRLRVTAQLIDTETEEHLWSDQYDRQLTDLLDVQTEISREVASALRLRLGSLAAARPTTPGSVTAYTSYLRGRYLYNQGFPTQVQKALDTLRAVVAEDPGFARAHAGIADCYLLLVGYDQIAEGEGHRQARSAAEQALSIDARQPEGHISIANVLFEELELAGSEVHFRRAIDLQPGLSRAHLEYSGLLTAEGRVPEAVREAELAEETDPVDPVVIGWLGYLAWVTGDTERALRRWSEWTELTGRPGRFDRMGHYALTGDRAAAEHELEGLVQQADPHIQHWAPYWKAFLAGLLGENEKAEALLDEYVERASTLCSHRYIRAAILGLMGEQDRTFEALGRPEDHAMGMWAYVFRTHPGYAKMRQDPRFAGYMRSWDPPSSRAPTGH